RRRIRDGRLTMKHFDMGGSSKTDVVVCYMEGIADSELVKMIEKKLTEAKPKSLTLGFQSLAESLIRRGWFNPFPKIRTTERPDTAAAQLLEGSILVICDNSPQVMILPTSIFHYLEQTDDYYFPPLTGTYLRIIRTLILLISVVITPLWYLYLEYSEVLPDALLFLVPDDPGALPIILQLFLVEFAIDGLKIASMNTPDMLSNSLSIVGALILGDFAVEVGWLSPDVILYMAFVAIANFAQQNHELGYAFKFMRMMILALVYLFGVWGFALGIVLFCVFVSTNHTVSGRHYLYPLIPFDRKAIGRLLIRTKKRDFDEKNERTDLKG
ncbi:MAG: spore germination protein, partial [Ruminococcaceae bacterium]|nr:spore germination protein [Oscillospiraceae bacterium]